MILRWIYRKILEKINLSKNELLLLRQNLKKENISHGPFIQGIKMCPTTTALSIKMEKRFKEDREVVKALNEIGINKPLLWLFYISYDLPSNISTKFFEKNLSDLRIVIDGFLKNNKK